MTRNFRPVVIFGTGNIDELATTPTFNHNNRLCLCHKTGTGLYRHRDETRVV